MRPVTVVLLAVALVACNRGQDDNAAEDTPARADSTPRVRAALYSEPEAIALLQAISDAEIAMARVAREKSLNDAVLAYAGVMIADHGALKQLITAPAQDNAASTRVRTDGDSLARALSSLPSGFNNTYIEEQVKAHQQALLLLDTAIVPSVRDTALRNLLAQARPTIAAHLQRALQILALRRREAQERGEPWQSGFQQPAESGVATPAPAATQPQPQPVQPRPVQPQPADTTPPITTTSNM